MGSWNNLQKGFTANERLSGTHVDVTVRHVFSGAADVHRPTYQMKKPPHITLTGYGTT
nr:hypothetical protein [Lentilactobacillus raoultii]